VGKQNRVGSKLQVDKNGLFLAQQQSGQVEQIGRIMCRPCARTNGRMLCVPIGGFG